MNTRKFSNLLASCAVALLVAACGQSNEQLIASAKAYIEKNDGKAAVIQIKNALLQKPDVAESRFLFGRALMLSGDPRSASIEFRRALDLGYPVATVMPRLLESLIVAQQYKEITDKYATTEVTDPQVAAETKTLVAAAYASQGNMVKAMEFTEAALAASPKYPGAMLLKARQLAQARKVDEAAALVEAVIAAAPETADAWYLKGSLLSFFHADADGAKAAYIRAIALKPDFLNAHTSLISLLLTQQDFKGAATQNDALRKLNPQLPQVAYADAQLAYLNKDNAKARDLTQQLLKYAPSNAQYLQLSGAIAYNSGQLVHAQSQLEKALGIAPELPVARALLARVQLKSGQPKRALVTVAPLLAGSAKNAEALAIAGEAHLLLGEAKLAEEKFANASQIDPKNTKILTTLALTRLTDANADRTFDDLRTISAQASEPYADLALISSLIRRKEFDQALVAIDALDKKQPGKPLAEYLRGQLSMARGNLSAARASFERAVAISPVYISAVAALADLDVVDKKPEAALKRFDAVLALEPKNVSALLAVAGLKARAGAAAADTTAALANVVRLSPGEMVPRLALISHLLAQRETNAAMAAAQDAAAAIPDNPEILDALGRAQLAAGDINQSLSTYTKLTGLRPDSPEPFLRMSTVNMAGRDPITAEKNLNRALDIEPSFLPAQQALTELLIASKAYDRAVKVARTVQKQRPEDPIGLLLEGLVEASRNRAGAAADIYRTALKKFPRSDIASKYHAALRAEAKNADAQSFASEWSAAHPKDAAFLSYLGENALGDKDFAGAEKHFAAALALFPGSPQLLNNLAWVKVQLKKPGAVALARKASDLVPNSPQLLDTLALALAADQKADQALVVQKKALSLAPNNPSLRLTLAKIYSQTGDKPEAVKELEALAKLPAKSVVQIEASELLARMKR